MHLGQVDAVRAVESSIPDATWLAVYVWCPRAVAEARIVARKTGDTEARMQAWDDTPTFSDADLTIDTATTDPTEAARQIDAALAP